ncbi:phospholipase-like protein [Tanacetum coccineum]
MAVEDTTPPPPPPTDKICNHFNKGSCKFGDRCKFIHDLRNRAGLSGRNGGTVNTRTSATNSYTPQIYSQPTPYLRPAQHALLHQVPAQQGFVPTDSGPACINMGVPKKLPRKLQREFLYSMTDVQGYRVKKINAPILEAIFKKHGDIASDCVVKTASVRESILEVVCEVVKRIQTNDVATLISDMNEIETQVLDAEVTNMKVAWLRAHLEAIQKRTAVQKESTLIVKMKANATLVKRAAKTDLEERRMELLTAQERFDKAEKCVKVLDLVEMKLNDNFVESEAEKDSWPEQPIL